MPNAETLPVLSITTTVDSMAAARTLAQRILADHLAACVQLEAVTSMYRWQGELHDEPEVRLVIKTRPECEGELQALFARHHPYDVPQFLVTAMRASAAYGAWVLAQVPAP